MRWAARLLGALPAEVAHRVAIRAAAASPFAATPDGDARLAVEAFGLHFPNPLGLAAGFDKNGKAVDGLGRLGFGFVEIGTLTPKPQAGNPKPRLFRLKADAAIVNRMGFNNDGYALAAARFSRARRRGMVGINIGPNKDSPDRVADYVAGIEAFAAYADYFTINISSPNTPGLRSFHTRDALERLLDAVLAARERVHPRRPVLLKIAPDLDEAALDDVLAVALDRRVDGMIVANTSIGRPTSLSSPAAKEAGGLSGRPIFSLSTQMLARCFLALGGAMPLIGVGGVEDAQTALAKIEAGASLVQIYTGLIYHGPGLIGEILRGLGDETTRRGVDSLGRLVGARAAELAARG